MLLHEQIEHLCESLKLNSIPTHWSSLAENALPKTKATESFTVPVKM
ncbi:hypothetical protein ArsFIN_53430 (plasmid) [Arsenophonus nasoniae]|nr:hypothetical protein ArsFIN_04230 [Arsenophonus nasoniae]QBY45467.1 hypothetical protein ArsFIN_40660 [Arsenophonus nasoniae]QBY45539.1 hypothetical protein ArsFIN_41500 [Arsenophonus nasoniae]QBY46732.1 hypothetical protein ArsFIN_53430 [Arsenophonus nasoniae]